MYVALSSHAAVQYMQQYILSTQLIASNVCNGQCCCFCCCRCSNRCNTTLDFYHLLLTAVCSPNLAQAFTNLGHQVTMISNAYATDWWRTLQTLIQHQLRWQRQAFVVASALCIHVYLTTSSSVHCCWHLLLWCSYVSKSVTIVTTAGMWWIYER